ncbi:hypothetical protein AX15_006611 [Amanita polypyramis BW_CC]|nr:hypothetical protein AX15_006611 [Amanita polypyramis BW_CC]
MAEEQRTKRFKHQSYKESLKEVHLPSTLSQNHLENEDLEDTDSLFHSSLEHWRQLNLAPSFLDFAKKVDPLCLSMPLLLHNWREIVKLWVEAVSVADNEGLKALLDLLQKLTADLRTTLLSEYNTLLSIQLAFLPKSISTDALSTLLSTLATFFKYLLVPSLQSDSKLLEETWTELCSILKKCLPEVQRAAAEVWGTLLRRLKGSEIKEKALTLLAQNLEGLESVWAMAFVYACKSVSQSLHTCTTSLFRPLLTYHIMSSTTPALTHALIRRSLTAFIHHVKNADQFSPVAEVLIGQFDLVMRCYLETSSVSQTSVPLDEQLRRMLEVIVVPCSVRQGSRLSHSNVERLFAYLPQLPLKSACSKNGTLRVALLQFATALYTASDMTLWLGLGRNFLQRSWDEATSDHPDILPQDDVRVQPGALSEQQLADISIERRSLYICFTLPLHASLAELSWGGWKPVALPLVLKHTLQLFGEVTGQNLDMELSRYLLAFIAALKRTKKLSPSEVGVVWRERLEKWCLERMDRLSLRINDDQVAWLDKAAELDDILVLSSFFSSAFSKKVVHLANRSLLDSSTSRANFSWVISSCLRFLATCGTSEWISDVDISTWTIDITKNWAWSPEVLAGLADILTSFSSKSASIISANVYPSLRDSLMSHSHSLRLAVLRLLESPFMRLPNSVREVVKRCLQGESVSLDVQGARERVVRIGRVGQIVADEEGADVCTRWLLGQLKVSLRPVWSPTAAAIASLTPRHGDFVWRMVFDELKNATVNATAVGGINDLPSWAEGNFQNGDDVDGFWEEERTWRDPSAQKIRSVVAKWTDDSECLLAELRKSLPAKEEFHAESYETQLLAVLGQCSSLAEKHNRELVSFFLSLTSSSNNAHSDASENESLVLTPKLLPRPKLSAYLNLFSKFSNPKALYATDTLHALYITLLSDPDRSLQSVSLSCLLAYKSPSLHSHEEKLWSLLDETNWKDELTRFDTSSLEQNDRKEIVDVLIRLLFGKMLEKRGRGRGVDRRATVLSALGACDDEELGLLVELMLKPLGIDVTNNMAMEIDGVISQDPTKVDLNALSEKQQIGFLNLLGDVLKNLGPRLLRHWPTLIGIVVGLIAQAHKKVTTSAMSGVHTEGRLDANNPTIGDQDDEDGDSNDNEAISSIHSAKVYRSIRQLGLKRLSDFFRCPVYFDFGIFLKVSFDSFISPRLAVLDQENTQSPSALLELFFTWARDVRYVQYFVEYDSRTLPKVYDCLIGTNVKPAVVSRVFDIVDDILDYSTTNEEIREHILKPHVSHLLTNLSTLVERTKNVASIPTPLGQRQIGILSSIAQYLTNEKQASTLIGLLIPLLRKPTKNIPEKVKVNLVRIIGEIMPLIPDLRSSSTETYEKVYASLSMLFQSLRSRPGRIALVSAFRRLASLNPSLERPSALVESLNAYSTKRVGEPDFDHRLSTFAELNENIYKTLSAMDWLPVLYNTLHFIQDHEELAVRSNSSLAMKRYIDVMVSPPSLEFEQVFLRILYPGLKNGLRSKSELVRVEVLGVIAYAVARCEQIGILTDMQILLAGGDEEANFFNNVLHLQTHRRSRALRRLADFCDEGHLRSSLLTEIFVPLVENFITSSTSVNHHLVNDAIHAISHMARRLSWAPYYSLVQKYVKLSKAKDESERTYIRTLVAVLDGFHFPMEDAAEPEADEVMANEDREENDVQESTTLASNATSRIADVVNLRLLPTLLDHLEKHDPTTNDNARLPIAIGIVNVAKHLPAGTRELQIGRLLTTLSQILRSHSQETRDLTREALQRIAIILGPTYLPQIIRELRGALVRGPQLHVLAFVTHALLAHVTSGECAEVFGNLDNCVNDVAYISAEVIFGESGKDVQAEGFKTKMREVRTSSSKGLDSFGVVARFVTPPKISSLLAPLRSLMHETGSAKMMNLVDEVLKRIAGGLNSNKYLIPKELIVLCHTLISQNAKFLKQVPPKRKDKGKSDVMVQTKRNAPVERDYFANNSYRFVVFGLDLFHTALRRTRFDLQDSEVMNRLNSMIVVVGNTLYSTSTPVIILGLRCAAGLAKCPLRSLEKSLPVFVNQMLDIIRQTGNTEAEVVQVAFKALATILRDGPPVQVKEKDLISLLELLSPDIEEPSRQTSVFTMLRAIVARKFIVPEIYDVMEKVSEVMVTGQSTQVQELCRGVLLQFLLDYPQGKGRLRTQMAFLAKNLSYVYESGRRSVMELLNAVLSKFQVDLIREYSDMLFIALVMVVANDDSTKCREMAAQLIKLLFTRLDDDRRLVLFSHLHSWASQRERLQLARVSAQVYGFIVEVLQADIASHVNLILQDLGASLKSAVQQLERGTEDEDVMQVDIEWQLPYHSLSVLFKVVRAIPNFDIAGDQIPWGSITPFLLFPHAWVRMASSRLLGLLFSAVPVAVPRPDLPSDHPSSGAGMRDVAEKLCLQLKSEHLDEPLSLQIVKNLFYVGKCFYCLPFGEDSSGDAEDAENNGEDDDIEGESGVNENATKQSDPLPWLFTKLSYQVRSAHIARRNKSESPANWHQQPLAIVRWFAAMAFHMDTLQLEKFLVHILSPIYRLTEDTIHDPQMNEIKTLVIELQDLVQNKVGVVKFSRVYSQIRQSTLNVRRERKAARTLQATTNPDVAAKRKIQRNSTKKTSRKRKERSFT